MLVRTSTTLVYAPTLCTEDASALAITIRQLTGTQIEIETLSANHTVGDLLQAIMAATEGDSKVRLVYEELPLDDESQTLGTTQHASIRLCV